MLKRVEHPRVFISYAWGTEEHDSKVTALATNLKSDGVDVVYDKWHLKAGNDTFKFMEKSVQDENITNVLIIIDPVYAQKANERAGGVGTETQIISSEVYNKTEQSKFIPVVFERNENGDVCKPRYLKGLMHFDLSLPDSFDAEYQRMVRTLFGIETYKEPELGSKPDWVENPPQVLLKSRVNADFFRGSSSEAFKETRYFECLNDLKEQISSYEFKSTDLIERYLELKHFRDEFLLLLKNVALINKGVEKVASFLEELTFEVRKKHSTESQLKISLIHEVFIYVVAYFLKKKAIFALHYVLNKTYFTGKSYFCEDADSFNSFYDHNEQLDLVVCKRDGKEYYSGMAALWIENLNVEMCNKDEFVAGDLFCHSASRLLENYKSDWSWFPTLYVYDSEFSRGVFAGLTKRLMSKEHLSNMAFIMGYDSVEEFVIKFRNVEQGIAKGEIKEYRYTYSFDNAQTFWNYIKADELGSRN